MLMLIISIKQYMRIDGDRQCGDITFIKNVSIMEDTIVLIITKRGKVVVTSHSCKPTAHREPFTSLLSFQTTCTGLQQLRYVHYS